MANELSQIHTGHLAWGATPYFFGEKTTWIEPENGNTNTVTVEVDGMSKQVNAGESFIDGVMRLAREAGLSSFKVLVGGAEVGRSDAPATFGEANGEIEIVAYQKAGDGA